jgi:molecular chaperone DnaK
MTHYIGIDLGTTNSAICSYDGETVQTHKGADRTDVTPSAIFFDRRGNRYVGKRAYDNAARYPESAAVHFKRIIGSATKLNLSAAGKVLTPEECSAEVLRTLYGTLPEDVRQSGIAGTVITVPAAFNQMQKDATLAASEMANIGAVALLQEPVAAVMAVMRQRKSDGVFLVYDIGGGTLDIAVAQSTGGRVRLIQHGGIAMCGGRDFDLALLEHVVKPWLLTTFQLPSDFATHSRYLPLIRLATWAAEKAKIELSARAEAVVALAENEVNLKDEAGIDIYLDVPIDRSTLDRLIDKRVEDSIAAAQDTLRDSGLKAQDVERIVFVGGPTHYKPLRDRVAAALGIPGSTEVNPMTAVAEGAAIFGEAIDWTSESRGRKSARGVVAASGPLEVSFNYIARTPAAQTKLVAKATTVAQGTEFEINSLDTGWSSGRVALRDGASLDLPLSKHGDNVFKVFVFGPDGEPIRLENPRIVVARTAATVDAIPASSSIAFEVLERVGGKAVPAYLVHKGDALPKKGLITLKAAESLRAGQAHSLNFKLWEGEISDPVSDNEFVGSLQISGLNFEDGVIVAGADLNCQFEVRDSGNVLLKVTVPSISFQGEGNFYSRGGRTYTSAEQVTRDAEILQERVEAVGRKVDDDRLHSAREVLEEVQTEESTSDPEHTKQALDRLARVKQTLTAVRKDNRDIIRQLDLDSCVEFFEKYVKQYARPTEVSSFESLAATAQRAIQRRLDEFETLLSDLRSKNFDILWRQDWFVADRFKRACDQPWAFANALEYEQLVGVGRAALEADDFAQLRGVVAQLEMSRIDNTGTDETLAPVNIVRG